MVGNWKYLKIEFPAILITPLHLPVTNQGRLCEDLCPSNNMESCFINAKAEDVFYSMLKTRSDFRGPPRYVSSIFQYSGLGFNVINNLTLTRNTKIKSECNLSLSTLSFSSWVEIYRILEQITSIAGPFSPPIKWMSSIINRRTFWTSFRCFQRRDRISQRSTVEITIP